MKPIDLLHSPILPGTNLIEASAGTGKTQTIAGLFLRLILEVEDDGAPIPVDQILVLTYTDAATEELRDRIRGMLVSALQAFEPGPPTPGDEFLAGLVQRHAGRRDVIIDRLRLSIRCFDLAPIFTIHGFCQRALKDRAFESGSLFDAEVLADQSALIRDIADDFWRRNFYEAKALHLVLAARLQLSPATFPTLLRSCLSHPRLRLLSRTSDAPATIAARLDATFEALRRRWKEDQATIRACFGSGQKWGKKPYNSDDAMAPLLAALERVAAGSEPRVEDLEALSCFTASALEAGTQRRRTREPARAPRHEFFDQCEAFFRDVEDYGVALQMAFLRDARAELPLRKEQLKVLSYDDLLTRLWDALRGPGGGELVAELRRRYRAALIDEFQDTDPIQAGIFRRIFIQAVGPSNHRLFLIGDPKQAIYGFRGADIFSYLQVSAQATERYTLGQNWRSDSALVRAVNTVFQRAAHPFVFKQIGFDPVRARGKADEKPLLLNGAKAPPLEIWFCPREVNGRSAGITKGRAAQLLPRAVAAEIARLLAGPNQLDGRPLRPQDFAVLVMRHREAQLVQDALSALRIPSVQQTQESIFASDEAGELLTILAAIARPSFEPGVRAALATRLAGMTADELHRLQSDEPAWQRHLETHRRHLETWSTRGFAAMFRRWLHDTNLRARLLASPGGERALTNALHLGELLHQAAATGKLGPVALTHWLADRIESDGDATADEHQLRLERDENAVQLVTVHKSKGLQYEIVFAPFCWQGAERRRGSQSAEVLFHHWDSGELMRDLGPDPAPAHRRQATAERLAESVRLFYVALTRARHRCYVAWGAFADAGTSAPAWLLHHARGTIEAADPPGSAERWSLDLAKIDDADLRADLHGLAAASADPGGRQTIAVTDLSADAGAAYRPSEETAATLRRRMFTGTIPSDWRIASFSWMTSSQRPDPREEPDHDRDDLNPAEIPAPAAAGIFAFPRGSQAGTCLHAIFETLELTDSDPGRLQAHVRRCLEEHGIDARHAPAVVDAVRQTLSVSLTHPVGPAEAGAPDFRLGDIAAGRRQAELEFCFALRPLDPRRLAALFADLRLPAWASQWPERLGQLTFSPTRGFLKGFIDLVCEHAGRFYLIDWKSNWLGNRVEDYQPGALEREMVARFYLLQYHLYAVALHRHLQLRLPGYQYEQHFGGVRYLFVRGIDPAAPGHGIFAARPDARQIQHLTDALLAAPDLEGAP